MALSFAQEDAEEELLAKALYVDNNDDKSGPFDATYQPSTAEDYLKGVMREAKSIGEVSIGTYLSERSVADWVNERILKS